MDSEARTQIAGLKAKLEMVQETITTMQEHHRDDMDKLFAKLDGLRSDVARHVPCPAPGSCVRLDNDLKMMADVVKGLEADKNKRAGERGVLAVVCTASGVALSFILEAARNYFQK